MIQILWNRHYHAGVTGSFHGDMAHAYRAMFADPECDPETARIMRRAIAQHVRLEKLPDYSGRKWFCEQFEGGDTCHH